MAYGPSERQMEVLRFVHGYMEAHGRHPSIRTIMAGIGCRSTRSTLDALLGLEVRGHIRRGSDPARTIELLTDVAVPRAADGAPLFFVTLPGAAQ